MASIYISLDSLREGTATWCHALLHSIVLAVERRGGVGGAGVQPNKQTKKAGSKAFVFSEPWTALKKPSGSTASQWDGPNWVSLHNLKATACRVRPNQSARHWLFFFHR